MNAEPIPITYRVKGKPETILTFDGAKHSVWDVMEWVAKRLHPDSDPNRPDPAFDRVMARIKKEQRK